MRLLILLGLIAPVAFADLVKTLQIGAQAPDFKLPSTDDKTYTLADFKDAKVLVVLFTCNHCPTAQAYEQRILDLHKDYRAKGIALVAISPNDPAAVRLDELGYTEYNDDLASMKARAKDRGFTFPYLYDGETQVTSRAYGALATPHVFIFDDQRKLRYVGRIDDSDVKQVTSHDAKNAIDALLAGKPVPVEKTRVFGCSTKWKSKNQEPQKSIEKWNSEPVEVSTIDDAALRKLAANDSDKLRLVNVWATWCGPCVTELPHFVEINRMYRKRDFELVTISADEPDRKEKALKTLTELHVSARNFIYTGASKDKLAENLDPKWEGPLPHTLLIAPGGKVIYRHTGAVDPIEVKKAIVEYLGRTYANPK